MTPDPAAAAAADADDADELITMGRVGVDLYPLQTGRSLADVDQFGKYLGGSPTNVAVAAARFGRRAAVITRTGDDPFGRFIHRALRGFGVDDRYVAAVLGLPTPVTFCEIFPPDDFPLYFYRYPKAPDLEIHPRELDLAAISAAGIFWATVTGLCAEPSRSATLAALRARELRHPTVLDLDFRPMFWASPEEASRWAKEALGLVTVAVGNLDECEMAVGTRDPDRAADALLGLGAQLAVIKQGPAGVLARSGQAEVRVAPVPVPVVNGLGAGDAFGGALCHGLLGGGLPYPGPPGSDLPGPDLTDRDLPGLDLRPPWDLPTAVRFANAAGALVASRIACADAMPTAAEVAALLEEAPGA